MATITQNATKPRVNKESDTLKKGDPLEYISASRVGCWQQCRRKHYFRYVAKVPAKSNSPALHIGKAVHAALQSWNLRRWKGKPFSEKQFYDEFMAVWTNTTEEDAIQWASREAELQAFQKAWDMLTTYIAETDIPRDEPILGVEVRIEAQLSGLPPIMGIIDLVRGGEQGGRIVDFKTAAKSPSASLGSHTHAAQLGIYAILYRENTGEKEAGIELHHLIKTKVPKVAVTTIEPVSDQQIAELHELLHTYVNAVKAGDFTPSPSFMCSSCEYLTECRNWKPQTKGELLPC